MSEGMKLFAWAALLVNEGGQYGTRAGASLASSAQEAKGHALDLCTGDGVVIARITAHEVPDDLVVYAYTDGARARMEMSEYARSEDDDQQQSPDIPF